MKIEVRNITYDCIVDGVHQSMEVLPTLPRTALIIVPKRDVRHPDTYIKKIERDWLVTGFDHRPQGATEWKRFDENLDWLHEQRRRQVAYEAHVATIEART